MQTHAEKREKKGGKKKGKEKLRRGRRGSPTSIKTLYLSTWSGTSVPRPQRIRRGGEGKKRGEKGRRRLLFFVLRGALLSLAVKSAPGRGEGKERKRVHLPADKTSSFPKTRRSKCASAYPKGGSIGSLVSRTAVEEKRRGKKRGEDSLPCSRWR